MYNAKIVIPGIAIFAFLVTFPVWFNSLSADTVPKPELPPGGEKNCVAPAAEMRDKHMVLLNQWRDDVLRDGKRGTIEVDGKTYKKGLQMACMQCHTSKEKFCDACHTYSSVKPYCWDCHLTPAVAASKEETH